MQYRTDHSSIHLNEVDSHLKLCRSGQRHRSWSILKLCGTLLLYIVFQQNVLFIAFYVLLLAIHSSSLLAFTWREQIHIYSPLCSLLQTRTMCSSSQLSPRQAQLRILSPSPWWPARLRGYLCACRGPPPAKPHRPSPCGLIWAGGPQTAAHTHFLKWSTGLPERRLRVQVLAAGKTTVTDSSTEFPLRTIWIVRTSPASARDGTEKRTGWRWWDYMVQIFELAANKMSLQATQDFCLISCFTAPPKGSDARKHKIEIITK